MEQAIKERFNEPILRQVAARFGLEHNELRLLDGFESYMFAFSRGGEEFILRVSHSIRRSPDLIRGEIDWLNYLAAGGASVATASPSTHDRLVEEVPDGMGGTFLATAFEKAPGEPPGKDEWNNDLFVRYGRLVGLIHYLSRTYQPAHPSWKRPEWDDTAMLDVRRWLPASDDAIARKYDTLISSLNQLPKDEGVYGLIHQDPHAGNFFVDSRGCTTLFDFDDCVYGWYVYDIAMALFYAAFGEADEPAFSTHFLSYFLHGYREHMQLDEFWIRQIPKFLKLREIDLYAVIHRSMDVDNIEDGWAERFMDGRRERIIHDVPFIDPHFMLI